MEYAPKIVHPISLTINLRALHSVVDCAEGTLRQFASQPRQGQFLKVNDVSKIFITHLHGKCLAALSLFQLTFHQLFIG